MNVLHVVADLDRTKGGPVTAILGLARAQREAGHAVRVAATDIGWGEDIRDVPVQLFHSWDRVWRFSAPLARRVGELVRRSDIVHLHGLWDFPVLAAAIACRRAARPYVVTLHGMLNSLARGDRSWRKRGYLALAGDSILRDARLIHFTTESEKINALAAGFSSASFVCPFGTELPKLRGDSAAFREHHGISADDRIVLFAGRLHPQKQLELLIASFARVASEIALARLVIAGGGDEEYARKIRVAARESAGAQIVFTGSLDPAALSDAYAACDMLVLPSVAESLGLAALEAMAAARPVVVTRGVGLASAIEKTAAGLVVEPDEVALAQAVATLLRETEGRLRMGANARRLVEARYAWPCIVRSIDDQYARALAARPVMP